MATLYIVATPIGNMEDITLRALRVLKEADLILAEDTRMTKKLLARHDIHTPTLSYHARSGEAKMEKIIGLLEEGKNLALVTDAGTPAISDPGAHLVSAVREHCADVAIVAIPGPSALTAALSVAGVETSDFLFLGFLPHKKGRETLFKEIGQSERTVVFYESPHRIMKTLEALRRIAPDRSVVLARELTKIYEEALCGTAEELYARLARNPQKQKGEFVVVVAT
ncbi:16S rRNA (cytidine(1402)-2'-O)-methyltransferase [Candidatus Kaiserbacteria bacterium]|nr:16S rRNA (cytidine(1402)-2'-O)-methyltransferase [Candidatus Kaiserbacteria bacterium]